MFVLLLRHFITASKMSPFALLNAVNVEMEIVLPGSMTVAESHDIALALQHKIEDFEEVERAFVHVCSFIFYFNFIC